MISPFMVYRSLMPRVMMEKVRWIAEPGDTVSHSYRDVKKCFFCSFSNFAEIPRLAP